MDKNYDLDAVMLEIMKNKTHEILTILVSSKWKNAYTVGAELQITDENPSPENAKTLRLSCRVTDPETYQSKEIKFIPKLLEIKNSESPLAIHYKLDENFNPKIQMLFLEKASLPQIKQVWPLVSLLQDGFKGRIYQRGRPKSSYYDDAFAQIHAGVNRRDVFDSMNRALEEANQKGVSWSSFKRTIQNRTRAAKQGAK